MARMKEFTVTIEDKPGALGRCFDALAEKGVNLFAFQSYVEEGESLMRMVVNDPATAKATLGGMRMIFEETEVAVASLENKAGELARAAVKLGDLGVNIDYSYSGQQPGEAKMLVVFGVDNIVKASKRLDEL